MTLLKLGKTVWRDLFRNRLRTFLMMSGIVVGITALTLAVSAGLGAQRRVLERVAKFGVSSVMVSAGGGSERGRTAGVTPAVTMKPSDVEVLRREVAGIDELAPFARLPQGDVSFAGRSTSVAVFGVTPAWAPVWDWDAAVGDFIAEEDVAGSTRTAVLGPTVSRELFGDANPIGETIQVGSAPLVVKGIMEAKGTSPAGGDMDNRVYVPLSTLMRRLANIDHLNGIKLRLRSADDITPAVAAMRHVLREQHHLGEGVPDDFAITTPAEITKMAGEVAGTFNVLLVLVSGISLIAGGVVVANIMLMAVKERTREIGLRKAVGAKGQDIMRQFLLEAVAVTATGGIAGVVLGLAGGLALQRFLGMPAVVSWQAAVVGLVFASVVGLVAGIQPARRAAALAPVDALRT